VNAKDTHNPYVMLIGSAELIDDRAVASNRFRGSQFDDPVGRVAVSLIAVRIAATRIELHVRGLTVGGRWCMTRPWPRRVGRVTGDNHRGLASFD
jgi:hypothetical protein